MKIGLKKWTAPLFLALFCAMASHAQTRVEAESSTEVPKRQDWGGTHYGQGHHAWHQNHSDQWVSIGRDAHLPAGQHAESVVSVLGSAFSEGEAENVVSVIGNTRVTGPLDDSAVSILGNTYVDSRTGGDVVAVLGNIELGPDADIGGDVVAIGGEITRDPAAVVHGEIQDLLAEHFGGFNWLRPWITHCLLYGRPLALTSGIDWAWYLALGFLAFYLLLALLFPNALRDCAQTFESRPGHCIVAGLLAVLLSPIVLVLLCITVIGALAVPLVVIGLFCADLFGKAVMLAWIGRRCLGARESGSLNHPAIAVLLGGAIVLVLYLVPVLGFVIYKLLGLLGFGTAVYALLQAVRSRRSTIQQTAPPAAAAAAADAAATTTPTTAPSPIIATTLPRAGFWIRMAALLLDAVLIGFLIDLLHHLVDLELLMLAVYGAVMWKLRGSTIGGIVFNLQVVRQDGRPIDWTTAVVRALGCFLSLAAVGLGFIWIAFDANRQAWHDKIAGTVVVRVAKGVSLV